MVDGRDILLAAYRYFNERRIDDVLARMHPDVTWPNGMEGGFMRGHQEVRAYWTRQWAILDPHVDPVEIVHQDDGTWRVRVHQVVHDAAGNLLIDQSVTHLYTIVDGLIQRMDILP